MYAAGLAREAGVALVTAVRGGGDLDVSADQFDWESSLR